MAITPIGLTKDEFNTLIDELFCSKPKGCSCKKEEKPKKSCAYTKEEEKSIREVVAEIIKDTKERLLEEGEKEEINVKAIENFLDSYFYEGTDRRFMKKKEKVPFLERKNKRISAMVSQMSLEELRELEEAVEIADRIIERLKY